jgi:hypothetical protein
MMLNFQGMQGMPNGMQGAQGAQGAQGMLGANPLRQGIISNYLNNSANVFNSPQNFMPMKPIRQQPAPVQQQQPAAAPAPQHNTFYDKLKAQAEQKQRDLTNLGMNMVLYGRIR